MVQKVFDGVSSKDKRKTKQNTQSAIRLKENFQVWLIIVMLEIRKQGLLKEKQGKFYTLFLYCSISIVIIEFYSQVIECCNNLICINLIYELRTYSVTFLNLMI